MGNTRRTLFSLAILLVLAMLVIPVSADETLTDTTITVEAGPQSYVDNFYRGQRYRRYPIEPGPLWYVEHTVEKDDRIGITVELLNGTSVDFVICDLAGLGKYEVKGIDGWFSSTWTVQFSGTYLFFIINSEPDTPQQVHITLVKKTGPCLGTLIIAAFPVIAVVCILGKRSLS